MPHTVSVDSSGIWSAGVGIGGPSKVGLQVGSAIGFGETFGGLDRGGPDRGELNRVMEGKGIHPPGFDEYPLLVLQLQFIEAIAGEVGGDHLTIIED